MKYAHKNASRPFHIHLEFYHNRVRPSWSRQGQLLQDRILVLLACPLLIPVPTTRRGYGLEAGTHITWSRGHSFLVAASNFLGRSEERRVGKECRSRWSP